MGVESAADRAVFTNPAEFGTNILYTPLVGGARTIAVIFDNESIDIDPGSNLMVSTVNPHFMVDTTLLVDGGAHGETFVINGSTYALRDKNPDGTGMTRVELKLVS